MERVLVLGSSGSGKSTFAQQLGAKLGIEVIHLDSYYWQPNWIEAPQSKWETTLLKLLEKKRWVMDGNYPASLPLRLEYTDTVVFLNMGRLVCLWRCVGRYLKYRGENRPELASGCYEKIDIDFLKWIWHYPRDVKPKVMEYLEDYPDIQMIQLKGGKEINRFISEMDGS
jgi:adenylate kinase family enzyme